MRSDLLVAVSPCDFRSSVRLSLCIPPFIPEANKVALNLLPPSLEIMLMTVPANAYSADPPPPVSRTTSDEASGLM